MLAPLPGKARQAASGATWRRVEIKVRWEKFGVVPIPIGILVRWEKISGVKMGQFWEATRRLEFDAGHRVFGHAGKCRFPHGHRYKVEITVRSSDLNELGMVKDFGDIKSKCQHVVEFFDHGFLVYREDRELLCAFENLTDHKTVICPFNPTAENIARDLMTSFQNVLSPLTVSHVRLYETPNCWADVYVQNQ